MNADVGFCSIISRTRL